MVILFVAGSHAVVTTQTGWEPQSMGSDLCCQMTGQVIELKVVTVTEVSQMKLGFLTQARPQLLGSVMEVET